jgi:serine protease DegQ
MVLLVVLGLTGCSGGDDDDQPHAATTTAASRPDTAPAADASFSAIPDLVEELQPSVVSIVLDNGEGSGVIVDADTIVTNAHVAGDADTVQVVLASGRRVEAEVDGVDGCTDLALLSVPSGNLPGAEFADELPRVGELAVALGNPLGFENTVTAGIVSGLHRAVPSSGQTPALIDLIQTDAPISPGNSGGALVNSRGQVVGISVAYIPPAQGAVSIGFAIPSATAVDVVDDLLRTGRATHAYLGIEPAQVTPEVAAQLGLDQTAGVLVMEVGDGTPAAKAGLRPGDVIVRLDDKQIDTVEDLFGELRQHRPGDRVTLTVIRDGREQQLTATLADNPTG